MGKKSKIAWTEATWNPVTGCTKISLGCKNCYAERVAKRLQAMGQSNYANGFELRMHPDALSIPLHWKKPRKIFVCSMSDLFHEEIPTIFIQAVFRYMAKASWHQFQVLTKRPWRMVELSEKIEWPSNVWVGVSIENRISVQERIPCLLATPAAVKFVSCEPLLEEIYITPYIGHNAYRCQCGWHDTERDLVLYRITEQSRKARCMRCGEFAHIYKAIDWVIVGGESGPGARPMELEWARDIQAQCKDAGIPFFMKQLGGFPDKKSHLEDLPEDLRIREFPAISED